MNSELLRSSHHHHPSFTQSIVSLIQKSIFIPFCCEYVIHSFNSIHRSSSQCCSYLQNREQKTEQNRRTTSTTPSNSFLFIMHSVHKVNAFKHRNFSLFQSAKIDPGVHLATYSMGTMGPSAGEG
jgi:hypothetical protein